MCIDIPKKLLDEDVAVGLVKEYFADGPDGRARCSGAYFERLGSGGDRQEVANQVTADDLLSVRQCAAGAGEDEIGRRSGRFDSARRY